MNLKKPFTIVFTFEEKTRFVFATKTNLSMRTEKHKMIDSSKISAFAIRSRVSERVFLTPE